MIEGDNRLWWQAFCAAMNTDGNVQHRCSYAALVANAALERYHAHCGSSEPEPTSAPYQGWARLEVMGHRMHYGLVREVRGFGTRLVEIRELNGDGELVDTVIQYGGSAIFALTQLEEDAARHMARGEHRVTCGHLDENGECCCEVEVWTKEYAGYCAEHRPPDGD